MAGPKKSTSSKDSSANLGFEAKLWLSADKLRNNMDAAEYKHVVLGLIFLKYISDSFEEHHARLVAGEGEYAGANPEDKDEYLAANVFWVPKEARWPFLQANAKLPTIGKLVDDAMVALERDNPRLKGSLNKNYGRADLDKNRLGELIDLIGSIQLADAASRSKDLLGRVFEYFLTQFASAEGKNGGQFYTPSCIVRLLVEMVSPYKGRIYDPACGSGGMFVQSEKFVESHGGKLGDISVYGQESNPTTRRLAIMNLALRGIEADFGPEHADTFRRPLHPDLRADYVLANPPFNDSDWFRKDDDVRWQYGVPPKGNANFAWVQHFIHHLAPHGMAGFVLANGSMSSNQSGEGEIRKALIEADLVDCMVALPDKLFYSTPIPVCLWFLAKNKNADAKRGFRERLKETLFIDARKFGTMSDPVHRELTEDDISKISGTFHAWRGDKGAVTYKDTPGFCKGTSLDEIRRHDHELKPGRFVGAEEAEDDELFDAKIQRLSAKLREQLSESAKLGNAIRTNLDSLAQGFSKEWFRFGSQGELPNGWRVTTIKELASKIQYGLTQSASDAPVGPHFLRITDIQGGRVDWSTVPFCKVTPEERERYLLKPGDVLVARTGASTGENIYLPETADSVFASYLVRFQFADPAVARFVGAFMRSRAYFDYVAGCIGGSAQPNASAQVLAGASIPVPPLEIMRQFAEIIAPLDRRIAAYSSESRTLSALRDALLPKLLNVELSTNATPHSNA